MKWIWIEGIGWSGDDCKVNDTHDFAIFFCHFHETLIAVNFTASSML
jgi:hypothetical protein